MNRISGSGWCRRVSRADPAPGVRVRPTHPDQRAEPEYNDRRPVSAVLYRREPFARVVGEFLLFFQPNCSAFIPLPHVLPDLAPALLRRDAVSGQHLTTGDCSQTETEGSLEISEPFAVLPGSPGASSGHPWTVNMPIIYFILDIGPPKPLDPVPQGSKHWNI